MFGVLVVALLPLHATPGDQPPPLAPSRLLTEWALEPWIAIGLATSAALYVAAVVVLRRRGDHWPVRRSAAFLFGGLGSATIATMSALGVYDTVLFSVHMVQHMILMMVTPMFAALGAPVTLALRAVRGRPRAALLAVLHSRPARVLTFVPLTAAIFIATPFALYYSPFYAMSLGSPFWHAFLHVHFLIVGSLLMWPLMGVDPVPGRLTYPLRLIAVSVMLPFHAFGGITLMSADRLIAESWYVAFDRSWPPSPIEDQYLAGAIMWGTGDVTALLMLAALFVQWVAHSRRAARREDRRLDRLEARARRALTTAVGPPVHHQETRYDRARTAEGVHLQAGDDHER